MVSELLLEQWPLFGLRIRTPKLELRYPDDDDIAALADLAAQGIHDENFMPFKVPWTRVKPPELQRNAVKYYWTNRGAWTPEKWNAPFVISHQDEIVGVQDVNGENFAEKKTVKTGSWLGQAFQGKGLGKEMRIAVLHFAFVGLDAVVAQSGAWIDNDASNGVSISLGYRRTKEETSDREGTPTVMVDYEMTREEWAVNPVHQRDDIAIEGLTPECRALFGV